jgi:hypothetical protein
MAAAAAGALKPFVGWIQLHFLYKQTRVPCNEKQEKKVARLSLFCKQREAAIPGRFSFHLRFFPLGRYALSP